MTGLESLAIDSDVPFEMALKHPKTQMPLTDKDGKQAFILLLGPDSEEAKKARRQQTQRALARRNRQTMSAEELEANSIEYLTALTRGWHLVNFDGEAVDYQFSPQNARALYSNRQMDWIKDQVDEAVGDRANFLKSSAKA